MFGSIKKKWKWQWLFHNNEEKEKNAEDLQDVFHLESSDLCKYTRACLDPQIKITTRLLLL